MRADVARWGMSDSLACTSFSLLWGSCGRAGMVGVDRAGGSVQAARGWTVGQPIVLCHRVFHRICHGQWAGTCSMGLRAGAAKRAGTLIRSPPMLVERNHVDLYGEALDRALDQLPR
jgi:hypothetical protein